MRRAFTLVELMVAVVVLLAVIVATSKIFATASKVTSVGEASADVLQQAGVLEEQLRRDLKSICQDGYMAIECVAVRNDVNQVMNGTTTAPLLNPSLPADAVIRADSIVFFKAGGETTMRWSGPNDTVAHGGNQQSRTVRVYYGHGIQLPELGNDPAGSGSPAKPIIQGIIPDPSNAAGGSVVPQILPWTWWERSTATGASRQVEWRWGTSNQGSAGMPRVNPNQPGARDWVLCRKAVLLADDLGSPLYYPDPTVTSSMGPSAAPSIFGDRTATTPAGADAAWMYRELQGRDFAPISSNIIPSPMLQSGWVDIASSDLGNIRRCIAPVLGFAPLGAPPLTYSPVVFPPGSGPFGYSVFSVVPPWASQPASTGQLTTPPFGWPIGASAAPWPATTAVVSPSIASGLTVNSFTSQRDRIIRGTFGPVGLGTSSTLSSGGALGYQNFGLLGWPRAEKATPNADRRSEILTTPVLSTNCSSFQIDWTWDRGTGRQSDATGAPLYAIPHLGGPAGSGVYLRGFEPDAAAWSGGATGAFGRTPRPQPWFGFPDAGAGGVVPLSWQRLGVTLAQDLSAMPDFPDPNNSSNNTNLHMRYVARSIEGDAADATVPAITAPYGAATPVRFYHAIFGFNQGEVFTVTPDGIRVLRDDYTPFPTQLRFTITLHDPRLVLDRGREFQFVIDLPRRKK